MQDFNQNMNEMLEEFRKLEASTKYRTLVHRNEDLTNKIKTLTDEIFTHRNDPNKISELMIVKDVLEKSLKEINDQINHERESVAKLQQMKLQLMELKRHEPKAEPKASTEP
jgi:hypothetical protein